MVEREVISFIQEQMEEGRDVRTVRDYLLNRGLDEQTVDSAFDKAFKPLKHRKETSSSTKIVVGGIALILVILVVVAFSLFSQIDPTTPEPPTPPEIINPPEILSPPVEGHLDSNGCSIQDTGEKYDCYVDLIEKGDIKCYKLEDQKEREFCFRTKDIYELSA